MAVSPSARRFFHVDVFTQRASFGNPLAVIAGADGLDTATMQAIAAWTNVIETTFILPPTQTGADYRLRIFTPKKELAFAGHPSVGSAHVVLACGIAAAKNGRLIQECGAGLLPVEIDDDHDQRRLFVQAPTTKILKQTTAFDPIVQASLPGCRLGHAGVTLADNGRRWWLAELAEESQVRSLQPKFDAIADLAGPDQAMGLCVFARSNHADYEMVLRALIPTDQYEDPASGAANAIVAGCLQAMGHLDRYGKAYRVSQGREVGRDAMLYLRVDDHGAVTVGGCVQTVVAGTINTNQWLVE